MSEKYELHFILKNEQNINTIYKTSFLIYKKY